MSRYLNSSREADWYACPSCGNEVLVGSAGCRKCQASPNASWNEEALPEGVEMPESAEDFDYEAWKQREFGMASKVKPHHLPWKYWLGGIFLLAGLIWMAIFAGYRQH